MEWTEIKSVVSFLHGMHTGVCQRDGSALSDTEAQGRQRQIKKLHGVIRALQKELLKAKSRKKKERLSRLLQKAQEGRDELIHQFGGGWDYARLLAAVLAWD